MREREKEKSTNFRLFLFSLWWNRCLLLLKYWHIAFFASPSILFFHSYSTLRPSFYTITSADVVFLSYFSVSSSLYMRHVLTRCFAFSVNIKRMYVYMWGYITRLFFCYDVSANKLFTVPTPSFSTNHIQNLSSLSTKVLLYLYL